MTTTKQMSAFIAVFAIQALYVLAEVPDYRNPDLSYEMRVNDLVGKMTLEEKVSQMKHSAAAVERLDIPRYDWWNECLHGVARNGVATVFPQAIGIAATWDPKLVFQMADVISTEARIKYHQTMNARGYTPRYAGLTMWSPNINIFRDPRWGRGQETYGEDPFLTSEIGKSFVRGLQGNDPRYIKVSATAKHYAVHSGPEPLRHEFDARISERDLRETYLPAFQALVEDAGVMSVMGAYNRYEGMACCANKYLLGDILREEWGFKGHVVSDCGAIRDIFKYHKNAASPEKAAAMAVKAGCDLNCGGIYPSLKKAVEQGLITEQEIDTSVKRLMDVRMRLGMFDDPDRVPYSKYPARLLDSPEHRKLNRQVAHESIVLLKNDQNALPLKKDLKKIAVLGPNADTAVTLVGNYHGGPSAPVTPLKGIRNEVSPDTVVEYIKGCGLTQEDDPSLTPIPADVFTDGLHGEYFRKSKFEGNPVSRKDNNVDFEWVGVPPVASLPPRGFSVRWTGTLTAPESGEYILGVQTASSCKLFIDDEQVLNKKGEVTLILEKGKAYKLKLEYTNKYTASHIKLLWKRPGDPSSLGRAVAVAKSADVAVIFCGLAATLEGEEMKGVHIDGFELGDRTKIALPAVQQKLIKAVIETGTPTVLVLLSGSALAVNWSDQHVPAIVQAWYPGGEGGAAIADVLFGDYNPAGRLPVTFYKSVDDLSDFTDYSMENRTYKYFRGEPLYPFGHGLSYTTFEYGNLTCDKSKVSDNDSVRVSVTVKNTGSRDGDEVVQVYLRDVESSIPMPIKKLCGFKRVFIKKGESKTVDIDVNVVDGGYWNAAQHSYAVEPGEMEVQVGASSADIRARKTLLVE